VSAHNTQMTVDIKDVHLHREDGALVGRSVDETTTYVLRLSREELCDVIDNVQLAPDGSVGVPEGRCPRCDFEEAVSVIAYAGEFIREHFDADAPGQLTSAEAAIVDLARAWAADDAINRCLEPDDD
jgi:hypothetical protein